IISGPERSGEKIRASSNHVNLNLCGLEQVTCTCSGVNNIDFKAVGAAGRSAPAIALHSERILKWFIKRRTRPNKKAFCCARGVIGAHQAWFEDAHLHYHFRHRYTGSKNKKLRAAVGAVYRALG
ncbi:MAG TPA: hypothetical protein VGB55_01510, partial [Tepidisphaeraceae bacterium]